MKRWPFMLFGMMAWLALGGFGLKWTAQPLLWTNLATLCGCEAKTVEMARQEFPLHVAPFPPPAEAPAAPPAEEAGEETADAATRDWAWRESRNRFGIVFISWMAAGWFIQWSLGRLIRGPRR
jgi:hypothetical protein